MSNRYLWDRGGDPDPDVQRLERALAPLAHRGEAPEIEAALSAPRRRRPIPLRVEWMVAAAATLVVVAGTWIWWSGRSPNAAWLVASLEGTPRIGSTPLQGEGKLTVGDWLETGPGGRVRADLGSFGQLEIQPETRLQLVRSGPLKQRLALAHGTVSAVIWAPPGRFEVETPSATAVDLGCAYTLSVDRSGAGLVRVVSGWVGFERQGRESFIPAGAACETRPQVGPGTPWYEDAPPALRSALERYDFGNREERDVALAIVLASARPRDAVTLWHLLGRTRDQAREHVFDRLAALAPPPPGVTRDGVLRGDHRMLDRWWDTLGLGETALWRRWKGSWPAR